jgi:cytochrome c peroxidase
MKFARFRVAALLTTLLAAAFATACSSRVPAIHRWSPDEVATLRTLSLSNLPPLAPDPSNVVADDPRAAALGERLFFDPGFSAGGDVACASCHRPELNFTDGRALAQGTHEFVRNSMSLPGSAWSPWLTWDGKADSQWMQALLPLENRAEHATDRTAVAHRIANVYADEYESIFGSLPPLHDALRFPAHAAPDTSEEEQAAWTAMDPDDRDAVNRVFVNVGKALAAYERTLRPKPGRFDTYVESLQSGNETAMQAALNSDEVAGLRLFVGNAHCIDCHNGPLFSNFEFHNTAVPPAVDIPLDYGRSAVIESLVTSEFNCLGPYSDAPAEECTQLRYLNPDVESAIAAFRTPMLRDVAQTAPYMHAGQYSTLSEVLTHYNEGGLEWLGHNELSPLGLNEAELAQLEEFLRALSTNSESTIPVSGQQP